MAITNTPTVEQWLLLGVFFLIFAVYGFTKSTRAAGCRPCYYISFGLLALVGNTLALFIVNRTGVDSFNLVQIITLKQTTIESSFIVLGYCLIIQGCAMFIRDLFTPAHIRASRSFL